MVEVAQQDPLLQEPTEDRTLNIHAQPDQVDDTVLDHDEIEEARARILQLHPYARARIHKLFPFLGCCFCECCFNCESCKKGEAEEIERVKETFQFEKETENENLQKVFQKFGCDYTGCGPSPVLPEAGDIVADPEGEDPLKGLGFGFEAYWRMLYSMAGMFIALTLIFMPEVIMCATTGGMHGIRNYADSMFTLGNLGFSASNCISQYTQIEGQRHASCLVGEITNNNYQYGILPSNVSAPYPSEDSTIGNYTTTSPYYSFCSNDTIADEYGVAGVSVCSTIINGTALTDYFQDNCLGTSNCSITFRDYVIDKKDWSYPNSTLFDGISSDDWYEWCYNSDSSRFFIQYQCLQDDHLLTQKRYFGLGIICLGFFGVMCYSLQVFYLKHTASLDFRLWDISTLTAADFTCEINIHAPMWEEFFLKMSSVQEMVPTHAAPSISELKNPVTCLYQYLETEITRRLNYLPGVIHDERDIKIAHITFAYDNKHLIKLLLDRGQIIAKGKFNKLKDVNMKIDQLLKDEKDKIQRPVAAFITFETQEGFERGTFYYPANVDSENHEFGWVDPRNEEDKQFLGHKLILLRATEPQNILWENRHTTVKEILMRSLGVLAGTTVVLILCLVLFVFLMTITTVNQKRYPPDMSCEDLYGLFNWNLNDPEFEKWAAIDKIYTLKEQGVGIYQCYCKNEYTGAIFGNDSICGKYDADMAGGYMLTETMTVAITVINMIIRDISIVFIEFIGFHTETQQTAAIFMLIALATFFNTAILMLLTNANTQYTFLYWIPLTGSMTDLDLNWYTDIGDSLIWTMLINSVYVVLGFFMQAAMIIVFRSLDKGCKNFWTCKQTDETKCKTIQAYVNTYAGPVHLMHFKYATVINTIYTCFMYGLALPLMFPIGALTFINIYVVEKLCVAYWYQKPPMYGPGLNDAALALMKWAPFLYFAFGYWIMGNKQIFNNTAPPIIYTTMPIPTDHNGAPWNANGPCIPMFFMLIGFCIMLCCGDFFRCCLKKCDLVQDTDEIEVDENLGNYFETLPNHARKNWLATELNNTHRLGIKTMGFEAFEQMRTTKGKNKEMKNSISYNILQNPIYTTLFQYVPMTQRDNLEEASTSDMVSAAIYNAQKQENFVSKCDFEGNSGKPHKERFSILHKKRAQVDVADVNGNVVVAVQ